MLIFAIKPGHDGAVAVLNGRQLEVSLESEKDSYIRHKAVTPETMLAAAEQIGAVPDVFAIGGWQGGGSVLHRPIATGYLGIDEVSERTTRMFGKHVTIFSSSHERSHLMMALGMAAEDDVPAEAVLIWEGIIGSFTHVDHRHQTRRVIPVLTCPGIRYALVYGVADPRVPDHGNAARQDYAGKLMALAAYGDPKAADDETRQVVDRLLDPGTELNKRSFVGTALHNAGVESEVCAVTAALLTERMFSLFAAEAERELPKGLPLRISGGCGLNCDWNAMWRGHEHFSSVFVPPCTNDSGSAIGTAIDVLERMTGSPHIDWDVYRGLDFDCDIQPDPATWTRVQLNTSELAAALAAGRVVAWVEGRWEIGPRALGHRSLLAEPFSAATRDRLNTLKRRESYRPIAPVCRIEDAAAAFYEDFADPYMLYFRRVRSPDLRAVTHVDGSARVQTVTASSNPALHQLLTEFGRRYGIGVLCNTSLNFHGFGFINRLSDLVRFCEDNGIQDMVVDGAWYRHRAADGKPNIPAGEKEGES
jgi:hydroxymethyl cephem carbamoyltransferase